MKRYLLLLALLIAALSGCTVGRSGSQTIEIAPWGWRPANEESYRILREAGGNPWAYPY
jgi:hypothetical protein